MNQIIPNSLYVVNIGIRMFYETITEQSVQAIHLNWPPPKKEATVEKEIVEILDRIDGGGDY